MTETAGGRSASIDSEYAGAHPAKSDESRSVLLRQIVAEAIEAARLTPTEEEIARLILKGLTTDEIARISGRSPKTVKQHITTIFKSVGVESRAMFFHCVFPT